MKISTNAGAFIIAFLQQLIGIFAGMLLALIFIHLDSIPGLWRICFAVFISVGLALATTQLTNLLIELKARKK